MSHWATFVPYPQRPEFVLWECVYAGVYARNNFVYCRRDCWVECSIQFNKHSLNSYCVQGTVDSKAGSCFQFSINFPSSVEFWKSVRTSSRSPSNSDRRCTAVDTGWIWSQRPRIQILVCLWDLGQVHWLLCKMKGLGWMRSKVSSRPNCVPVIIDYPCRRCQDYGPGQIQSGAVLRDSGWSESHSNQPQGAREKNHWTWMWRLAAVITDWLRLAPGHFSPLRTPSLKQKLAPWRP